MKILACTDYYTPHTGGVEIAAANLYRELAEKGHEITVMTLSEGQANHDNITVKTASKIEVTKHIGLQSSLSLNFPGLFLSTLRNGDYDLLHVHNRFFYTSTIAASFAPILNIPLVFSLHTSRIDMYSGIGGALASLYEASICRRTIRNADYVICNSKATAKKAFSLGANRDRLSIHLHGVDTSQFSPRKTPPSESLQIVYVGRLVKNKGVLSLVDIFRRVKQAVPTAKLEIVGEGPLEEKLQSRFSQDSVTFHGSLPHEKVAEIYKQSNIFCLPSKSEGLSLTTLEAMATGLPVVVSDTGGLREIVQDTVTGFRVPSTDSAKFSDTIIKLWQNPTQWVKISNNAREYILSNHSWEQRAETIESIFLRVQNT